MIIANTPAIKQRTGMMNKWRNDFRQAVRKQQVGMVMVPIIKVQDAVVCQLFR